MEMAEVVKMCVAMCVCAGLLALWWSCAPHVTGAVGLGRVGGLHRRTAAAPA